MGRIKVSEMPYIPAPSKAVGRIKLALRFLWIAIRLTAVFVLIRQGSAFFYQGF
jgi:hypothetical protein